MSKVQSGAKLIPAGRELWWGQLFLPNEQLVRVTFLPCAWNHCIPANERLAAWFEEPCHDENQVPQAC
jgi:hypothetical protein